MITTRTLSNANNSLAEEINAPAINLFPLTVMDSSVELVWTSKDNSVKAASYDIYRDDAMIKSITSFTYIDTGLSPETNYTYYIKAKDSDGKEFADNNKLNVVTQQASAASGLVPLSDPAAIDITEISHALTWDIIATTPGSVKYPDEGITGDTVTTTPGSLKYTDGDILRSTDPDFETDRYIIKYKDGKGREKLRTALKAEDLKSRKITTPVQVSGLSGITTIAGGDFHSLALKNDGTVWAWGNNYDGQLGDGTTTDRTAPVQVIGLSGITAIAGGEYHSLALKNDGAVWVWGDNYYGQLGNGEKGWYEYARWVAGTPSSIFNTYNTYLVLKVQNMDSFTGRTFSIAYNPWVIEDITDLCAMTYAEELETGTIEGTDITIIQNSPGTIKFTVNKAIEQGKNWSGVVNIISFTSSDPNISAFTCTIE